ncbi:MAG TPA: hypothetical protein VMT10_06875 [Solirubrobacteraceae bacterium]|nr:hypothetical protein [Solirubrobacteraceae bacterium]
MSTDETTPWQDPGDEPAMVDVTVKVPAHRVAQFERFHHRFLEMARFWDSQVGNEDLWRGSRGRRGRRRHGGRCGHGPGRPGPGGFGPGEFGPEGHEPHGEPRDA